VTNGQVLQINDDAEAIVYPYCFCGKQLSEGDMQVLFRKEAYERVKSLTYELIKNKPQRVHNLVEEQGYKTRKNIVLYARDYDLIDSKEILQAIDHNKSIENIQIKIGQITDTVLKPLAEIIGKNANLNEIELKDVTMTGEVLQKLGNILGKTKIKCFKMKNCRLNSQRNFEYIGAILWQGNIQDAELKNVGMNDYGLTYLAEPIAKLESLKSLNLSSNIITRIGLKCIEDVLKDNEHLRYLGLKQKSASGIYYDYIRNLKSNIKGMEIDS